MLGSQLIAVSITFICGLVLGVIFDIWWVCREIFRCGRWFTSFGDLIFCLVAALLVAAVLWHTTDGELRGWYFISTGLGFVSYRDAFSPEVRRPLRRAARVIRNLLDKIGNRVRVGAESLTALAGKKTSAISGRWKDCTRSIRAFLVIKLRQLAGKKEP